MEGVSLDEDQMQYSSRAGRSGSGSSLSEKLVSWGVAKTTRQADVTLLVTAAFAIVIAGFIYFSSAGGHTAKPETPASKDWPR